jgi:hypothetical protein
VLLRWTPYVSSLSRVFPELEVSVMAIWNQRFTALRAAFIRKLSNGPQPSHFKPLLSYSTLVVPLNPNPCSPCSSMCHATVSFSYFLYQKDERAVSGDLLTK